MQKLKCKICRRSGAKLFLKGERCFSAKCAIVKKPYIPGERKRKNPVRGLSEYGKELKEKQKLRNWYSLREGQFKKYVEETLEESKKEANAEILLMQKLESRLDNVIFRLGFATSRKAARQMVSHSHFLVNEKPVNTPSYLVKKGDKVSVKQSSLKKVIFQNIRQNLKKVKTPLWLVLDSEKMEGKVANEPNYEEAAPPAEISLIFEFYSR